MLSDVFLYLVPKEMDKYVQWDKQVNKQMRSLESREKNGQENVIKYAIAQDPVPKMEGVKRGCLGWAWVKGREFRGGGEAGQKGWCRVAAGEGRGCWG